MPGPGDEADPHGSPRWTHVVLAAAALAVLVGPAVPATADANVYDVTRCYEAGHGWGGFDNQTLEDAYPARDPPRIWGDGGFLPQARQSPARTLGAVTGCDDIVDVWGVRVRPRDLPPDAWGEALEVRASIDDARADPVIGTVCSVVNGDEYCGNQGTETLAPFCGSTGWVDVEAGWGALGIIVGNLAHTNIGCGQGGDAGGGTRGVVDVDVRVGG